MVRFYCEPLFLSPIEVKAAYSEASLSYDHGFNSLRDQIFPRLKPLKDKHVLVLALLAHVI